MTDVPASFEKVFEAPSIVPTGKAATITAAWRAY